MNYFLIIIITFLVVEFLINLITRYFNISNISYKLPSQFSGIYDKNEYRKTIDYIVDKTKFANVSESIFLFFEIIFILIGGFNYIDIFLRGYFNSSLLVGVLFLWALILISSFLSLPFSYFNTFHIEEKYSLNNSSKKTFLKDFLKSNILSIILGGIIFLIVIYLFNRYENSAWLLAWVAVIIFSIILQYIGPKIIMPIFNKFEEINDQELKDKIIKYCEKENFNIEGIYKMDGSRRTKKMNAFFTGFGKNKRIVFYDTMLEKLTHDEIIAILAHEMGHFRLKHIVKSIVISIITTGIMFYILSFFIMNKQLFSAFKMENLSIYGSIIFFGILYSPINYILSIISNYFSRKKEYEADNFSLKTTSKGSHLISALKKLSKNNLSNLKPHFLNVFLNYSHPPILQRIRNIKERLNR